jgi:hypothetical protein
MTRDCNRLKFLSAFFFFPIRSFLARLGIRYDISSIANAYYQEDFDRIPAGEKAVVLPHCLIGEECKARFSKAEGILCMKCKNCRCGEIRILCEEKGWQFYISPSTNFTKRLVQRKQIRVAVGGGVRFRDRQGRPVDADHAQRGPFEEKEGHSPGYPDDPV